jgi:hypothetical protein
MHTQAAPFNPKFPDEKGSIALANVDVVCMCVEVWSEIPSWFLIGGNEVRKENRKTSDVLGGDRKKGPKMETKGPEPLAATKITAGF